MPLMLPYLYTCWSPFNEISSLPFSDASETLVYLTWVNLSLNDVEDADVSASGQVLGTGMRRHLHVNHTIAQSAAADCNHWLLHNKHT